MPTFDTPEPISVTLSISVGNTRITASDRVDTVVDVRPRDESSETDLRVADQTSVDYANGTLQVRMPKQRSLFGRVGSVDVTIDLPAGSQVRGDAAMGSFRCVGRLGECRLKTSAGDLEVDHTGAAHLKTAFGDVTAGRVSGDADVVGSGELRIGEVDGTAVIKNSNGDTTVGEVTGDLRASAANGDISVGRAHAAVGAKTAAGSVRIGEVIRGTVTLETAAGGLEVGIREGTAAWLDLSTMAGSVRNSLAASQGPTAQSTDTVEVRARTSYGDIVVRRS